MLILRIVAIFLLLCMLSLFRDNVESNELHKFIEAAAVRDPNWLPGAFTEQPDSAHRQWLYQLIAAPLLERDEFLAASILGRMAAYALLAVGLALVTRTIGLSTPFALAVVYAMYTIRSMAAGEWIIGGVEPKVFAYGLVLVALALLMREKTPWLRIALLLATAAALHVLVGIYAAFSALVVWAVYVRSQPDGVRVSWKALALLGAVGLAALIPAYAHFTSDWNVDDARIYISLRVPHHLDPSYWSATAWLRIVGFSALFACAWLASRRAAPDSAQQRLAVFCAATLVPFAVGLLVAPFEMRWHVLSFYPFRFADVMIPFGGLVLGARALQHALPERMTKGIQIAISASLLLLLVPFYRDAQALRRFPVDPYSGVTEGWYECVTWIRAHTPRDALFVVPPIGSESFPWLARRRALAVFKHTSLSGGLTEWKRRLTDLAGWEGPWPARGWDAARWIATRYEQQTTERAEKLMQKYDADYWIAPARHSLDLPIAFSNAEFIVYARREAP